MAETNDSDARRVADLTVAELRQLIKEVVSDEGDVFAMGISTEADQLLDKFRTLVVTSSPNWADVWAHRWAEIAAHLETNLAEGLRAVNAPTSAPDIARELARYSDNDLNSLLWHEFPKNDLAAIRAAVHKRLAARGADHWTLRAAQVETILTERLRARNVPAAAADVVGALGECLDADLNGLLGQSCSAHELAEIRAAVRARLGVGDGA